MVAGLGIRGTQHLRNLLEVEELLDHQVLQLAVDVGGQLGLL